MALLTVQTIDDPTGEAVVYSPANASDTVKVVDGRTKLLVRTAGTATTVTITVYKIVAGLVLPNRSMSVSATQDKWIPLTMDYYTNPADGLTTIAITPTTSVTTAVVSD